MLTVRETTITADADDTYVGTVPQGFVGVTLTLDGNFDSATATAEYKKADGTLAIYNDTEATGTSDFEVAIRAGQGKEIYIKTVNGAGSVDIDVGVTYW